MSSRRQLRLATVVWMGSLTLARIVGAVREAVIGRVLGGGGAADAYWSAFALPMVVHFLLGAGVLALVFIPLFGGHLSRGDAARAWSAFSVVATALAMVTTAVLATLWLVAPWLMPWVGPGYEPAQLAQLTHLTRIVLPAQLFVVTGGLLSATLQARDHHLLPALAQVVASLVVVGFGVSLGPWLGAEGFAWGVLAGSVVGSFGLPAWGCWRVGLRFTPRLDWNDPDLRAYARTSVPVVLTLGIVLTDEWLSLRWASLGEDGLVTRLTYARFLMKAPVGILGMAIGSAAFPTLTRLMASARHREAAQTLWRAAAALVGLALLAQLALTIAGEPLATLLFGTTRFSGVQLAQIARLTALLSLGMVGWCLQNLLVRGFYALGEPWPPAVLALGTALLAPGVYAACADCWGADGLALASAGLFSGYALALAGLLSWRLRRRVV